jgi:hypothetical protein
VQRATYTVKRTTHAVARDGAQAEILRVAIASELNIPTAVLTAKSYPAAGGVTHTEETFDCGAHAAQTTPAQLIDSNLELLVLDLPDGGHRLRVPVSIRLGGRVGSARALRLGTWLGCLGLRSDRAVFLWGGLSRPPPVGLQASATLAEADAGEPASEIRVRGSANDSQLRVLKARRD